MTTARTSYIVRVFTDADGLCEGEVRCDSPPDAKREVAEMFRRGYALVTPYHDGHEKLPGLMAIPVSRIQLVDILAVPA